jgi:zinc protease
MRGLFVSLMLFASLACLPAQATPRVQEVSLRDLSAWLVSDTSLPIFTLEMAWQGGSATDPDGKSGLSMLMARLMNEGAGDSPAKAFQQALADKAISLSFNAGRDEVTAKLRCLKRYQDACLGLHKAARFCARNKARARWPVRRSWKWPLGRIPMVALKMARKAR